MNLLKSKLRRATAVAAGTLIGLAGVAFFASPASAHYSGVEGTAKCVDGNWVVNWEVSTDNGKEPGAEKYRFLKVDAQPAGSKLEGIAHTPDDSADPFPHTSNETLKGVQIVDGNAKEASLEIQVKWSDEYVQLQHQYGYVKFDGTCSTAPKPEASLASSCEGVTVTLTNGKDATKDAEFQVEGSKGFKKDVTVKPGEDAATVEIPAENAKKVVVTEKSADKPLLEGKWEKPEDCTPPPSGGDAQVGYEVSCDSILFGIDNSEGDETITLALKPNKGEDVTLVAKPGETKTIEIKGQKGLIVKADVNGEAQTPVNFDKEKPGDCETPATPTPTESAPGEGGGLPVTGPVAGSIAGGAALLLAVGGVLFFLARRRKVNFTA
ncbi:cell wall anchor protein [Actinoplanes sp. TRM 88003]|uniref:Cell wall anchor protein n=1 Tax=Paractinoplanes aksuensis TaxID=2939490 RepID=A0ABT1DMB0_9ACTN|nr:cell wall anchor protein [Actinoplanes aksuensis]MCO8271968.1 cell wall anchor protein [Actinoplanes aksuensis]